MGENAKTGSSVQKKPLYSGPSHLLVALILFVCCLLVVNVVARYYGDSPSGGRLVLSVSQNPVGWVVSAIMCLTAFALVYCVIVGVSRIIAKRGTRKIRVIRSIVVALLCSVLLVGAILGIFAKCDICCETCVRWQSVNLPAGWHKQLPSGVDYTGSGGAATICQRCLEKYGIDINKIE